MYKGYIKEEYYRNKNYNKINKVNKVPNKNIVIFR